MKIFEIVEFLPYIIIGAATVSTEYPVYFIFFILINSLINTWLKNAIRQPRPASCPPFLKKTYGMPSCHSQMANFATAFVWPSITNERRFLFVLFTATSMVQRVLGQCHSFSQVVAGMVVGLLLGAGAYQVSSTLPPMRIF